MHSYCVAPQQQHPQVASRPCCAVTPVQYGNGAQPVHFSLLGIGMYSNKSICVSFTPMHAHMLTTFTAFMRSHTQQSYIYIYIYTYIVTPVYTLFLPCITTAWRYLLGTWCAYPTARHRGSVCGDACCGVTHGVTEWSGSWCR